MRSLKGIFLVSVLLIGILALALAAMLPSPSPAQAAACPTSLVVDTTLTADCEGGIIIGLTGDNITLDCAGHTVTGPGFGGGIRVYNRTGVTVQNCTVTNFDTGFDIGGGGR